jgi:hypothetical protein
MKISLRRSLVHERRDLVALVGISAASIATTIGPFLWARNLYHDTLGVYIYSLQNFESLHRFGEPAWWSPQIDYGYPTYFYALLGVVNAGKPAFVLVGSIVWLLGRLGIGIPSMLPVFILYFGALIPLLFLLGVWRVARHLFRSRTAIFYVLIVAAFSPGVILNLSDPGILEYTAYCLYFTAAYLSFVARPGTRSFALLCLAAGVVSLAVSQYALMTAIPWLPMLVVVTAVISPTARLALRRVPLWQWTAAALLVVAAASPSLIAYAEQKDELTQYGMDGFEYSYARIKPGNPLEFLLASVPAIGFEWDRYEQADDGPPSEFGARGWEPGEHSSFDYLGLLAVPLAAVGLVHGRRRLRLPLFIMLVLAMTVLALASYSPLFSLALMAPSPLRSMNHYGDLLYRGGGFLLVLFSAGMGLEAAQQRRSVLQRLPAVFAVASTLALLLWLHFDRPAQSLVGFSAALMACFSVVLLWARRLPRGSRSRQLAWGVLALTLIDVSTAAFWHIRLIMLGPAVKQDEVRRKLDEDLDAETQKVVLMREIKRIATLGLQRLPAAASFCNAHVFREIPTERDFALARDTAKATRSLALPEGLERDPALRGFFEGNGGGACDVKLEGDGDYNTIRVRVTAAQPALVFLRDAYSKPWRATLNGVPTAIYPAFGAFKAVVVPAGRSELHLRFSPPLVGPALVGAYSILLLLGLALLLWRYDANGGVSVRGP